MIPYDEIVLPGGPHDCVLDHVDEKWFAKHQALMDCADVVLVDWRTLKGRAVRLDEPSEKNVD